MDVRDLRALVTSYNSKEVEIFDGIADKLVHQIRNNLEEIMDSGNWAHMIGFSTFGVVIDNIGRTFQEFKIQVSGGWNLTQYENLDDYDELIEFNKFMEKNDWMEIDEVSGFQGGNISQLRPFVNALMRKGFTCYVDTANYNLVVVFTV